MSFNLTPLIEGIRNSWSPTAAALPQGGPAAPPMPGFMGPSTSLAYQMAGPRVGFQGTSPTGPGTGMVNPNQPGPGAISGGGGAPAGAGPGPAAPSPGGGTGSMAPGTGGFNPNAGGIFSPGGAMGPAPVTPGAGGSPPTMSNPFSGMGESMGQFLNGSGFSNPFSGMGQSLSNLQNPFAEMFGGGYSASQILGGFMPQGIAGWAQALGNPMGYMANQVGQNLAYYANPYDPGVTAGLVQQGMNQVNNAATTDVANGMQEAWSGPGIAMGSMNTVGAPMVSGAGPAGYNDFLNGLGTDAANSYLQNSLSEGYNPYAYGDGGAQSNQGPGQFYSPFMWGPMSINTGQPVQA